MTGRRSNTRVDPYGIIIIPSRSRSEVGRRDNDLTLFENLIVLYVAQIILENLDKNIKWSTERSSPSVRDRNDNFFGFLYLFMRSTRVEYTQRTGTYGVFS